MSQPSLPFHDTAIDPFLPSNEQEAYTQAQLDELFEPNVVDHPVFSSANSKVLNTLNFSLHDGSHLHAKSNTTDASTPDLPAYTFDPTAKTPLHAYPQQTRLHDHGRLTIRAHTNSPLLLPLQPHTRRRSLSHGDADRIATGPPNPTFVRLQAPRARSVTPEDKRRGPYPRHGRSGNQGPGRALKMEGYGSPLIGGLLPMPIGTPLDEEEMRTGPLLVRHMTDPTQLARSRRIIEIGAMAVRQCGSSDSRLEEQMGPMGVIRKLDEVERCLKRGEGNEDALKGCRIIREALAKRGGAFALDDADQYDPLDVPSKMLGVGERDSFGGCLDEIDMMGMLMRENERHDVELEDA